MLALIEFLPLPNQMFCRPSPLLALAASFILAAPLIAQSTQPSSQSSGITSSSPTSTAAPITLSGQVINSATGLPVPRALVRFNQRAMLADNEGRFRFDQVTDTTINIQAIKPGFSMTTDPADVGSRALQAASITGPVEIRLYPEAILIGNVSSAEGAPLSQVSVVARRSTYDENGHHWNITGQTQTDRHGDFRIPVAAGDYKLETRYVPRGLGTSEAILPVILPAPGSDTQVIHIRSGQEQRFDIHPLIRPTYPVPISVESNGERGLPMLTARSTDGTAFNVGMAGGNRGPDAPLSDQSGLNRSSISLPAGSYTLTARIQSRDSNETAEARVNVTRNAESSGATLRFTPTPTIPVELIIDPDATSDNTQSSSVQATTSTNTSNPSTITSSSIQNIPKLNQFGLTLQRLDPIFEDDPNTVGLSGPNSSTFAVPPGSYRLLARTAGRWYIRSATYGTTDLTREPITITTGGAAATIRVIVTNLTGSLQGTVLINGVPSTAWVYLIPNSPSLPSLVALHSGTSGNLNGPYVPPGTYRVIAFERRHYTDFSNPQSLGPFSKYIQTVTVGPGASSSVYLNAVPQLEAESHP